VRRPSILNELTGTCACDCDVLPLLSATLVDCPIGGEPFGGCNTVLPLAAAAAAVGIADDGGIVAANVTDGV
jgi:hypothetical protein